MQPFKACYGFSVLALLVGICMNAGCGSSSKTTPAGTTPPEVLEKVRKLAVPTPSGLSFREDDKYSGGMLFVSPPPEALPLLKDIHNLTSLHIDARSEESLKHLENLKELRFLDVDFGGRLSVGKETVEPMNEKGFYYLRNLQKLEKLKVNKGGFGQHKGAEHLGQLPELQEVLFEDNGITNTLVEGLKDCPKLRKAGFFGYLSISDEGLKYFGGFKSLEELAIVCHLPNDPATRAKLRADWALELKNIPKLKQLKIAGNVGPGLEKLKKEKPELAIKIERP